jgi:hypothetical protein
MVESGRVSPQPLPDGIPVIIVRADVFMANSFPIGKAYVDT